MDTNTLLKRTVLAAVVILLSQIACTSKEDKAHIRQAVTAFNLAFDANGPDERLMDDLQKAMDMVPDGAARTQLLTCQELLKRYRSAQKDVDIEYWRNLSRVKDPHTAMSKAKSDNPLPNLEPLAECFSKLSLLAK